jgi:hypothetical protein
MTGSSVPESNMAASRNVESLEYSARGAFSDESID